MKPQTIEFIEDFFIRHKNLKDLREDVLAVADEMVCAFQKGNKLLL